MQWLKNKPTLPPGLNPEEVETSKSTEGQAMSKAAKKNAKRKEKKKQQQQSGSGVAGSGVTEVNLSQTLSATKLSENTQKEDQSSDRAAIEKKIRNLKKKLKQVDDLKAKVDSGELANPEKEQLAKIARRHELVEEIENLELDLEDWNNAENCLKSFTSFLKWNMNRYYEINHDYWFKTFDFIDMV